jgi:hypothetical protein
LQSATRKNWKYLLIFHVARAILYLALRVCGDVGSPPEVDANQQEGGEANVGDFAGHGLRVPDGNHLFT